MEKIKAAVVSFTDPRSVKGLREIDKKNIEAQKRLVKVLKNAGVQCFEPFANKSVNSREASRAAASKIAARDVDCLILGCWKWTDPMLAVDVARAIDRPLLLVGEDDETSTPLGCLAAVGAALWEIAPHDNAMAHERIIGDFELAAAWARGAGALSRLRKSTLLLWGGSYCLKMSHLEDDPSALKRFLVGDILIEDQLFLTTGAEKILSKTPARVDRFVQWLEKSGAQLHFDKERFTPKILRKQAALYLAARDRLSDLEEENICGVSVKCQPALSELYGATCCIAPALLPFDEDSEGRREIIPTVCEGDIKGLITSMLLKEITGASPGFGDIRHISVDGKTCLIVSNCGGASVCYSGASVNGKKNRLSGVYLKPQCQGAAGCAVGYMTPAFGTATLARLIRKKGEYKMQYAVGESKEVTPEIIARLGWGDMWPVSIFDIGMDLQKFTSMMGSNHYSFVPGDVTVQLKYACRAAGIEMEYLGSCGCS